VTIQQPLRRRHQPSAPVEQAGLAVSVRPDHDRAVPAPGHHAHGGADDAPVFVGLPGQTVELAFRTDGQEPAHTGGIQLIPWSV